MSNCQNVRTLEQIWIVQSSGHCGSVEFVQAVALQA